MLQYTSALLYICVHLAALPWGNCRYVGVERYQLKLAEHLNAVRFHLQGSRLDQGNCTEPVCERLFTNFFQTLLLEQGSSDTCDELAKVIRASDARPAERRLVQRRLSGDGFQMDCVFLCNDTVLDNSKFKKLLNLTKINEGLSQDLNVTSIRPLRFPETLTYLEVLGGTVLLFFVSFVVLVAVIQVIWAFVKFTRRKLQRPRVVWFPVETHETNEVRTLTTASVVQQTRAARSGHSRVATNTQVSEEAGGSEPVETVQLKSLELKEETSS